MITPIENLIARVDLDENDSLLPLMECITNSIISLNNTKQVNKEIKIKIIRGMAPTQQSMNGIKTIHSINITDNGLGFNNDNYKSFETPHSLTYRDLGCLGIGRFTMLAAFEKVNISSNYYENQKWYLREFMFDRENEVELIKLEDSKSEIRMTKVELINCNNPKIKDKTALRLDEIAIIIKEHFFIYYLCEQLPEISLIEDGISQPIKINEILQKDSYKIKREFSVSNQKFFAYITKSIKEGNRKIHYAFYCANSRVVGQPTNINKVNDLFNYSINIEDQQYYLEIYIVSEYLNKKMSPTRNAFNIPLIKENGILDNKDLISFEEINNELVKVIEKEFQKQVSQTKEKALKELENYIINNAVRYRSLLKQPDLLKTIPANLSDDKKEEYLHRITFNAKKFVDNKIQKFITEKKFNEESINEIKNDLRDKTAYDVDSLADYMLRRKAIIDLFEKFLEADKEGSYKLEEDIHNLIFPMGLTNDDINFEMHNLWLLDERFISYKFINSAKSISSISQLNSRICPDLWMFDNPIGFGDKSSGELNSLVIFEFKRPGEIAYNKNKNDFKWEFSELIDKYFDEFLYSSDKKNYKGRQVIVKAETPKFGFIILDVISPELENYNRGKGWQRTPFGSYYKMTSNLNLHIEVMTFTNLKEHAFNRHSPFFDKLFG